MDEKNLTQCVLVTGATGFIGSALAAYFYARGFKVRALTRDLSHPHVLKNPQYDWVLGDLTQSESLANICDNIDFVLHAAGFAHASKKQDPAFHQTHHLLNYQATINIAQAAIKARVKRFIFFSTVKAVADSHESIDELWKAFPIDAYGIAKRNAEEKLLALTLQSNMEAVILRLSLVYGVGWKGNLAMMLKAIDKHWMPPVPCCVNQKSMVSVHDVCLATKKACFATLKSNRIFIVTDGYDYSTHQIYYLMREALGKGKSKWAMPLWVWRYSGRMGDFIQKLLKHELPINSEAIQKLLGNSKYCSLYVKNELKFSPQHSLESVLPEIISAYRSDAL